MVQAPRPKIEFPCRNYPIKVMGDAGNALRALVLRVMEEHAEFDPGKVTVRDSRNGRFQSVTVYITATGESQLKAIHRDLKASEQIKMVL